MFSCVIIVSTTSSFSLARLFSRFFFRVKPRPQTRKKKTKEKNKFLDTFGVVDFADFTEDLRLLRDDRKNLGAIERAVGDESSGFSREREDALTAGDT